MESISIADGQDDKKNRDAIPSILSDALAVSFDNNIGHDYLLNYEERYEFYHKKEEKIPFDLEYFNKVTKGGLLTRLLTSRLLVQVSANLYSCATLLAPCCSRTERSLYWQWRWQKRRLLNELTPTFSTSDPGLDGSSRSSFENKVTRLAEKTQGSLIIKEYPTASAHSGHFKALLNELAIKKSFRPDIIFIDYLNIYASSRYKSGMSVNSYELYYSYCRRALEDCRGRGPYRICHPDHSFWLWWLDVDLTDTSESFGLPATADLMFALISTEELEQIGQIMVKQLKNRYNDPTVNKRFIVGIDRAKMRLYDCEQTAQDNILDSGQEEEYNNEERKKSFEGFKFW